MNKKFFVVVILICFGCVSPGLSFLKGPAIKLSSYRHNFGNVFLGQRPSHAFYIKNVGDQDLVVDIKPD
jgi:hypothetical protein